MKLISCIPVSQCHPQPCWSSVFHEQCIAFILSSSCYCSYFFPAKSVLHLLSKHADRLDLGTFHPILYGLVRTHPAPADLSPNAFVRTMWEHGGGGELLTALWLCVSYNRTVSSRSVTANAYLFPSLSCHMTSYLQDTLCGFFLTKGSLRRPDAGPETLLIMIRKLTEAFSVKT